MEYQTYINSPELKADYVFTHLGIDMIVHYMQLEIYLKKRKKY